MGGLKSLILMWIRQNSKCLITAIKYQLFISRRSLSENEKPYWLPPVSCWYFPAPLPWRRLMLPSRWAVCVVIACGCVWIYMFEPGRQHVRMLFHICLVYLLVRVQRACCWQSLGHLRLEATLQLITCLCSCADTPDHPQIPNTLQRNCSYWSKLNGFPLWNLSLAHISIPIETAACRAERGI